MTTCKSCGARIVWALTAKRKRIPIDPDKRSDGNLLIAGRLSTGELVVATMKKGDGDYVSHFATCPNAQQHRKKPT